MPRPGLKPMLLIILGLASYPLVYVAALMQSAYPWLPVFMPLCLRGQGTLLHWHSLSVEFDSNPATSNLVSGDLTCIS